MINRRMLCKLNILYAVLLIIYCQLDVLLINIFNDYQLGFDVTEKLW